MADFRELAQILQDEGFGCIPVTTQKAPALPPDSNHLYSFIPITEAFNSYGLAICCGSVSGGFEAVDFDKHNGQDIEPIFDAFMSSDIIGHLINAGKVSIYKTRSGGYHCYMRSLHYRPSEALARWKNDGSVMIETRGQGSYIIVNPTPGYTHVSGVEYIKLIEIEKDERDAVITLCRSFTQTEVHAIKKSQSVKKWGEGWNDTTAWGKFNKEEAQTAKGLLTQAGWTMTGLRKHDGVELWRRPGKDKGISATFGMYENLFYCFTGSASPFEMNKSYSPTDILMLTKFGGNWNETKKYLEGKYNLNPVAAVVETELIKPNEFPIDVFPLFIQQYINELNKSLNYNKDFLSVAHIFNIATLNGNKYKLRVKNGWIAPTTFWFAGVGEPGTMKTHPISSMIDPLRKMDKENKLVNDLELSSWEQNEKKGKKPRFRQMLVMDYTLESIHDIHSFNPRGLGLYKDELVGFLNDMNKYRKGSDEQFWLESFNNKSYMVNRVTKDPLLIDNIMINIIGTIQPDVLLEVATANNGNGLIDRFLYTTAETEIYPMSLTDIDSKWISVYAKDMEVFNNHFAYTSTEDTELFEMTQDALLRMVEIDGEFCTIQKSEDETTGIRNYVNKMKTYLPRFALIVAIMQILYEGGALEVDVDHMNKAKRLCDYFINSARFVFDQAEKTQEINNVKRSMQASGLTKAEQIIKLNQKGFKNVDISRQLKTPTSYVSKILNNSKL
jgi:hypothetical protein